MTVQHFEKSPTVSHQEVDTCVSRPYSGVKHMIKPVSSLTQVKDVRAQGDPLGSTVLETEVSDLGNVMPFGPRLFAELFRDSSL